MSNFRSPLTSPRSTLAISWPTDRLEDQAARPGRRSRPTPTPAITRHVAQVMGMPISLALRGPQADCTAGEQAWTGVVAELQRLDAIFSTYRSDSVISKINLGELGVADGPVELTEVLRLGAQARAATDGAFDVYRADRTPAGDRMLDPSGVVKGWAVQRAARSLDRLQDTDYCLAAGGDLTCRVADPGRPGWRIGIEDPLDPQRLIETVEVRNGAVATSGTAHRGSHIVDPRTGRPPIGVSSVTVVADSLTEADLDATCGYLMGIKAAAWLRGRPDRAGIVVWSDGTRTVVG